MSDSTNRSDQRALLVLRCQRGEREAWTELVAQWERPLFYYLRRMSPSREEALNLLQDVWVHVFSGLASLREPERLAPWLYVIARRAWTRRFAPAIQEPVATDALLLEVEVVESEENQLDVEGLHLALQQLALRDREVLTLFYLDDLSLVEVAEVLEIPLGTVKSRLGHARSELRARLERMKVNHD